MVQTLPVSEVGRQLASGTPLRLIDVRSPAEFASGHAQGAISMPLDALDPAALENLPGHGPIYVICRSGVRSEKACRQLVDQRFGAEVISVAGGTEAWARAGLPMELPGQAPRSISAGEPTTSSTAQSSSQPVTNSTAQPNTSSCQTSAGSKADFEIPSALSPDLDPAIANRVRLIAGSLVLLGVVLGFAIHPALHLISAIPGLGLIHAGTSGSCLMGTFLGRLAPKPACANGACQSFSADPSASRRN
jgi:rhodanese-related sulfurtransferase